jgi:hypothetical protein
MNSTGLARDSRKSSKRKMKLNEAEVCLQEKIPGLMIVVVYIVLSTLGELR